MVKIIGSRRKRWYGEQADWVPPKGRKFATKGQETKLDEKIKTDAEGMDKAYAQGDLFGQDEKMFVAGSHAGRDWFDDVTKIPMWIGTSSWHKPSGFFMSDQQWEGLDHDFPIANKMLIATSGLSLCGSTVPQPTLTSSITSSRKMAGSICHGLSQFTCRPGCAGAETMANTSIAKHMRTICIHCSHPTSGSKAYMS